jgi:hypothetical protein
MAPKTVQEAFNLKPEELNALAVLSGLEGYRGAEGRDVATVAANVLARRLKGNWGGIDIRNIAKSPGQYQAVFDYSMQQLADPAFGAKVLGGQSEFERVRNIVNNPSLVGKEFERSKGAQSFRGVAAYGSKKPEDYVPVPGKSNFYFNPLDQDTYKKGVGMFGALSPAPVQGEENVSTNDFLKGFMAAMSGSNTKEVSMKDLLKQELMGQLLSPQTVAGPLDFLSSYLNPYA